MSRHLLGPSWAAVSETVHGPVALGADAEVVGALVKDRERCVSSGVKLLLLTVHNHGTGLCYSCVHLALASPPFTHNCITSSILMGGIDTERHNCLFRGARYRPPLKMQIMHNESHDCDSLVRTAFKRTNRAITGGQRMICNRFPSLTQTICLSEKLICLWAV